MRFRYAFRQGVVISLLVLAACPGLWAQDPATESGGDVGGEVGGAVLGQKFVEITDEMTASVNRGLQKLAALQKEDGSFGSAHFGRHVGITSLACLAFMSHGDLPNRGPFGSNVQRGLSFVLDSVQETGLIAADTSHGPMYGHGFATLFLGEVYGQTQDKRVRDSLVKAVRLIVACQNHEGGWRYQPVPNDADVSVTICQIKALRSARNAGIKVPKETIDRAVEYVRNCQNADGGFRYMMQGGGSAFPRSAAGIASLYYAGVYADDALDRGLKYLTQNTPGEGRHVAHYFYGQYYAVQAMFMAGGKYWKTWFPAIREELLSRQDSQSGLWSSQHGTAYGTAMALIVLQMPNRYLPIFQR